MSPLPKSRAPGMPVMALMAYRLQVHACFIAFICIVLPLSHFRPIGNLRVLRVCFTTFYSFPLLVKISLLSWSMSHLQASTGPSLPWISYRWSWYSALRTLTFFEQASWFRTSHWWMLWPVEHSGIRYFLELQQGQRFLPVASNFKRAEKNCSLG